MKGQSVRSTSDSLWSASPFRWVTAVS